MQVEEAQVEKHVRQMQVEHRALGVGRPVNRMYGWTSTRTYVYLSGGFLRAGIILLSDSTRAKYGRSSVENVSC